MAKGPLQGRKAQEVQANSLKMSEKNPKFRFLVALLTLVTPFAALAKEDYQIENQPQVIEKALVLENFGELKQKDNGYL